VTSSKKSTDLLKLDSAKHGLSGFFFKKNRRLETFSMVKNFVEVFAEFLAKT
jgi:hypothetical protein